MQMPERAVSAVKRRLRLRRAGLEIGCFLLAGLLTATSAVLVKEGRFAPPLTSLSVGQPLAAANPISQAVPPTLAGIPDWILSSHSVSSAATELGPLPPGDHRPVDLKVIEFEASDPSIRWFNGRPVRPVKRLVMTVTAYSPDAVSCGEYADGMTATLHDVTTNAHRLVAADRRLLPFGSMVSIPGYDQGQIVPVLDCGGRIRGHRLDVLYPTHDQARRWGVQKLEVVVWGYADGKPTVDPRRLR
ncbi:MAG: 3D domain-containing protein [Phycisphaeraceae bacterium]|nr:3D domain-containing protein [Phycisphaerae bacterium]MBX3392955.1 3D domain-containing protein [Phycisphaeraceae bacterium]